MLQHIRLARTLFFKIFLTLGLAGLLLALAPVIAAEVGPGTIKGKMINKTANGGSVAGQEVSLATYFGETEKNKTTAKTAIDGSYQFTGLPTSSNYSFKISANYQGADYNSESAKFGAGEDVALADITVYDSTTSDEKLRTETKHIVVDYGNGALKVTEILIMNNTGDKTYIGSKDLGDDKKETTRYVLPKGAKGIEYGEGLMSCCIVQTGEGFSDSMAINPGQTQKVLSYLLPYDGTSYGFSTLLTQPTDKLNVFVPDSGATINSAQLASSGRTNIEGKSYLYLSGQNLAANTTVSFSLSNLPKGDNANVLKWAIPLMGLAVIGLGAGYGINKRKRSGSGTNAQDTVSEAVSRHPRGARAVVNSNIQARRPRNASALVFEKDELVQAIAHLDDWYEAGRISQADYQQMRSVKKGRLMDIMRQLSKAS